MLTLQGPLNLISMAFGCKGIDIKSVTYTESLESLDETLPTEYFEMIDSLFTLHLALALVWLAFGGLQIFLAQTGWSKDDDARHKAHRMFGRFVAGPAMIGHVIMTTIVTLKNPVNQSVLIQFMYLNAIYSAFQRTFKGLMYAREAMYLREESEYKTLREDKDYNVILNRHNVAMVRNYVWTTFGSGAIRLTSWILFDNN